MVFAKEFFLEDASKWIYALLPNIPERTSEGKRSIGDCENNPGGLVKNTTSVEAVTLERKENETAPCWLTDSGREENYLSMDVPLPLHNKTDGSLLLILSNTHLDT